MNILRISTTAALIVAASSAALAQTEKQGTTYRSPGGGTLKLMLDDSNVGPEVTVGELTFPANTDSGEHTHGAIEMFYVLSGDLEHVVHGKGQMLKPGMVGYVKPPDKIRHKTGPAGAKVVVMWVPGAEANKIVSRWTKEPRGLVPSWCVRSERRSRVFRMRKLHVNRGSLCRTRMTGLLITSSG